MTTLAQLIDENGANAFVYADRGNGSGFGELGQMMPYDDDSAQLYGQIELRLLATPVTSEDGTVCTYSSDWQDGLDREQHPYHSPSDYKFRILF